MARVRVGEPAPDFALEGIGGKTHRLADHSGEWLVLAFYPGDFTPVCTRQFCAYRDGADRLDTLDAAILGISPQTVSSHERFTEKHELTVPLLADPDRSAIKAYGVGGPAGHVRRSIFVIDPEGVIRHRDVALLGLRYRDVESLATTLDGLR
ncbi:MAG: peroxiredoxin [Solirubrobacterales bacterium]